MGSLCRSLVSNGSISDIIDVECHLSNNLPTIVIVGFAGKAVNEAKDRLRGAFGSSRLPLPRRRITINLAPADLPKSDSSLDLAIAVSIFTAADTVPGFDSAVAAIGELSLDGQVRPVRGVIGKLLAGRQHGVCSYFVPFANREQASLVPNITLYPVSTLRELYDHLTGTHRITPVVTGGGHYKARQPFDRPDDIRLDDISGQESAKRALIIAAAGGHNILLTGPPGTGKSMLAKALPGLLPLLSHEEMLEATHLRSLTSTHYDVLDYRRPLRSPHHSISMSAMVGGGRSHNPGEVSLSHRGILLLDEFPEFNRQSLEALRQPLEDGVITVARSQDQASLPARFMLVATANPCPCGFNGFSDSCTCTQATLKRYRDKLSGPIIDRLDLCCNVHVVNHEKLLLSRQPTISHREARQQVQQARAIQFARQGKTLLNSQLTNRQLKQVARLDRLALMAMQAAAHNLQLSARGYMRCIKVARTIADLEQSGAITAKHVAEALTYRQRPV